MSAPFDFLSRESWVSDSCVSADLRMELNLEGARPEKMGDIRRLWKASSRLAGPTITIHMYTLSLSMQRAEKSPYFMWLVWALRR